MYRVVLLDADGTLFDYPRAAAFALETTFSEFGLGYDRVLHLQTYNAINDRLWRELELGKIGKTALQKARFTLFFEHFEMDIAPDSFDERYLWHLSEARYLVEGAGPACECLAKKARLAVVSNGIKAVQMPKIAGSPLNKYFEHIIVSEDAGYEKPHPGIFEHALGLLRHEELSTVLMVGDSLSADVLGGVNYGIDTCWYNPENANPDPNVRPTYTISSLAELCDVF